MNRLLSLLCLLLALVPALPVCAQESTTRAEQQFEELLGLQQELLALAAEAEVQTDIEKIRPRLQTLVFDWEDYLRRYPEKTDGYIAYSMLLGNPLIDERRRAKALLLKANELDPNQAIVKNQLGKYIAEDGEPLLALPYFLAAAELEPEEPLYHYQIGQILGGARSDFLQSGEWTVESIDAAMQKAFAEAVRLQPDSLPYAYRYAESYYDLEAPPWDEALVAWQALEQRVELPIEQQMMRLHQANVRLFQGELDAAAALLQEAVETPLVAQQNRLLARLERLRNPPPEPELSPDAVVVAEAPAAASEPAPIILRGPYVNVPDFKAANAEDVQLSSQDIVRINDPLSFATDPGALSAPEPEPPSATADAAPDSAAESSPEPADVPAATD